jgi:hypothetical protein
MFSRILFNLIQVLVVLAFAPLVSGVASRLKEIVQSKRGPSIFQPYRDLWKLFHKDEIVSEESSWIFRFTPYIVFVTPVFVTLLIPVLTKYPLFLAFMGDMLGGGFVLSLGGFFAALAAVDTANPFGPMGASRTRMVGFLLALLCLLFGVLPTIVIPALNRILQPITGANAVVALIPPFFSSSPGHAQLPSAFAAEFHDLGAEVGQGILPVEGLVVMHRGGPQNPVVFAMSTSYMFPALLALLVVSYGILALVFARRRRVTRSYRWDGGVRALLPEMTYTATGFSNPVRVVFEEVLRPDAVVDTVEIVSEHFRTAIRRRREEVHIIERYIATPVRNGALKIAARLAAMHRGRINDYAGYGLATLIIALVLALSLSVLPRG